MPGLIASVSGQLIAVIVVVILLVALAVWAVKGRFLVRRRRRSCRAAQLWEESTGEDDEMARAAAREAERALRRRPRTRADHESHIENRRVLVDVMRRTRADDPDARQRIEQLERDQLAEVELLANGDYLLTDEDIVLGLLAAAVDAARTVEGTYPGGAVVLMAQSVRRQTAESLRRTAEAVSETEGGRVETQLRLAREQADDSENSHDPAVTAALRATMDKLRATQGDAPRVPIAAIRQYIIDHSDELSRDPRSGQPRPEMTQKALAVLDTSPDRVVAVNGTSNDVLELVWGRAGHPRNRDVTNRIRQAVFDGLVDAKTQFGVKCAQGRTARYIGALATHDFDDQPVERVAGLRAEMIEKGQVAANATTQELVSDSRFGKAARARLARTMAELDEIGDVPDDVADELRRRLLEVAIAGAEQEGRRANSRIPGCVQQSLVNEVKQVLTDAFAD